MSTGVGERYPPGKKTWTTNNRQTARMLTLECQHPKDDRYSEDYKLSRTQPHRIAREGMHSNTSKLDCKRHLKHEGDIRL